MKSYIKKIAVLAQGDLRNIFREPMMMLMLFAPVLLVLVMKFLVPFVAEIIVKETGFVLMNYKVYIETFFMIISAMMMGMITGFIILDERDDEILLYFSVTPLSKKGYLLYRVGSSIIAVTIIVVVISYLTGMRGINLLKTLPMAFIAATEGPMIALFLVVFAKNKVEGLAMAKLSGFLMMAPFAILIPSQWHFLGGVLPPFWITKIYIEIQSSGNLYFLYIFIGLIVHTVWLLYFLRRFKNKVY